MFIECCKLGIPWLGLIHDWSKFLPNEFIPYSHGFFGKGSRYTWLNKGWLHHQHRNKHHWQRWVMTLDHPQERAQVIYPMPSRYRREMLADWRGASLSYGFIGCQEWYAKHRHKMLLHEETRVWLERELGVA